MLNEFSVHDFELYSDDFFFQKKMSEGRDDERLRGLTHKKRVMFGGFIRVNHHSESIGIYTQGVTGVTG